jgi:hypothetical protein
MLGLHFYMALHLGIRELVESTKLHFACASSVRWTDIQGLTGTQTLKVGWRGRKLGARLHRTDRASHSSQRVNVTLVG